MPLSESINGSASAELRSEFNEKVLPLIAHIRRGDGATAEDKLATLVTATCNEFVQRGYIRPPSGIDPNDLVQDTTLSFLRIVRNPAADEVGNPYDYVRTTIEHLLVNAIKRKALLTNIGCNGDGERGGLENLGEDRQLNYDRRSSSASFRQALEDEFGDNLPEMITNNGLTSQEKRHLQDLLQRLDGEHPECHYGAMMQEYYLGDLLEPNLIDRLSDKYHVPEGTTKRRLGDGRDRIHLALAEGPLEFKSMGEKLGRIEGFRLRSRNSLNLNSKKDKAMSTPGYELYEEYKQSFGFNLMNLREDRQMSRAQLADGANRISGKKISEAHLRQYEIGQNIPDEPVYKALETVLIRENNKIEDKDAAAAAFRAAYMTSLKVIKGGSPTDVTGRMQFANLVSDYREKYVSKTEAALSLAGLLSKVEAKLDIAPSPEETEFLRRDKEMFIAGIEAGTVIPSRALMYALVQALNEKKILTDGEKRGLYEAYDTIEPHRRKFHSIAKAKPRAEVPEASANGIPATVTTPKKSANDNPSPALEGLELDQRIRALKDEMRELFKVDGEELNFLAIGNAAELRGNEISVLMGPHNNSNPRRYGALAEKYRTGLSQYLKDKGLTEKAVEFERVFDEMRNVTGWKPTPGRVAAAGE